MEQQEQKSRIERDMDAWKRIEDKLISRYGSKIANDRHFLKAKRHIYKHIHGKYKNKRLNQYEKAELRVLRGQHRQLLRQVYPNSVVRLVRNILVFAGNAIKLTGDFGWKAARWLVTPDRTQSPGPPALKNAQQKPQTGPTPSATRNQGVVRKMPRRPRVQMPMPQSRQRMRR